MKYTKRFRMKSLTSGEYKGYNPTYFQTLQDRINSLRSYTRPTWYNKRTDTERKEK